MINKIKIILVYVNKFLRYLTLGIVMLIFLIISYGMFMGTIGLINLENQDFIKYLINISFILAGFTFLTFFSENKDKFKEKLISPCWLFILSGFLLLAFITLPNITSGNFIFNLLQAYNYLIGIFGLLSFVTGLAFLVIVLFLEQDRVHEIINKKKGEEGLKLYKTYNKDG